MPALKARIAEEMKAALLGRHRFRGDVLRNLKAAILNEEVALGKRDKDDDVKPTIGSMVMTSTSTPNVFKLEIPITQGKHPISNVKITVDGTIIYDGSLRGSSITIQHNFTKSKSVIQVTVRDSGFYQTDKQFTGPSISESRRP